MDVNYLALIVGDVNKHVVEYSFYEKSQIQDARLASIFSEESTLKTFLN